MKIAVFSDTHGNSFALDAMIRHTQVIGVEQYLNLGDMVGYYMQPKLVVRRVRNLPGWTIQGNHERILRDVVDGRLPLDAVTEKYGEGHSRALNELTENDRDWLFSLPIEIDIEIDGLKIKMCHGAPGDPDRYVYPDTSQHELRALCDSQYNFIFAGHTHYPFLFQNGSCLFVNVGSLGQSKDIGGLASWGLLDTSNQTFTQMRTPYRVAHLIEDVRSSPNRNEAYLLSVLGRNHFDEPFYA